MISSDSHFFTNEEGATVLKSFEKSYLSKPGPIISRYLSTKIRCQRGFLYVKNI